MLSPTNTKKMKCLFLLFPSRISRKFPCQGIEPVILLHLKNGFIHAGIINHCLTGNKTQTFSKKIVPSPFLLFLPVIHARVIFVCFQYCAYLSLLLTLPAQLRLMSLLTVFFFCSGILLLRPGPGSSCTHTIFDGQALGNVAVD